MPLEDALFQIDSLTTRVARGPAWVGARVSDTLGDADTRRFVIGVGIATVFFGFLAGAIANLYLVSIGHPLVTEYRTTLSYGSAIFGDGILLPIVNMIVAGFVAQRHWDVTRRTIGLALAMGVAVTTYFHVEQAMQGIVNWTMPQPWHWNILGVWHAGYMLAVTSWLCFFGLLVAKAVRRERSIPQEAVLVVLGIAAFFVLLRLDYMTVDLRAFVPLG